MPEFLAEAVSVSSSLTTVQMAIRLVVAALFGVCVAVIYRFTHGRQKEDAAILTATLVLLSILIAMVSMVVGDSVARAFSLVGALSIVRFRTVVEDTRDTAFVIFAVIVGMAAGAGLLLVAVIGIPIVAGAALLLSAYHSRPVAPEVGSPTESTLTVRLGLGRSPESLLDPVLARHLDDCRLVAVQTAKQGSALDFRYRGRMRSGTTMAEMVAELNQIEGVQTVELLA